MKEPPISAHIARAACASLTLRVTRVGDPSKGLSGEFSLMLNSSIKPYAGNYPVTCAPIHATLIYESCASAVCQCCLAE